MTSNFTDQDLERAGRAFMRAKMDGRSGIEEMRRELTGPVLHITHIEVEDKVYSVSDPYQLDHMQIAIRELARKYRFVVEELAQVRKGMVPH